VREYFPPAEAATRVGLAISSTIIGMALGGWMGGALFDMTGSYRAAFLNGIAWNIMTALIACGCWLGRQDTPRRQSEGDLHAHRGHPRHRLADPLQHRNAYIDFSQMTASVVAIETDLEVGGKPVIGYGFNSNGRYAQKGFWANGSFRG